MKLIGKLCIVVVLALSMIVSGFIITAKGLRSGFSTTYQAVIQRKYDYLMNIVGPKIILVGGSNLSFGIDREVMEKKTGYPVANMGLHAGMGYLFNSEIAKANIQAGDIVVLAYEYGWTEKDAFDTIGQDLVVTGIDNRLEMYKQVPSSKYLDIFKYSYEYAVKKVMSKVLTKAGWGGVSKGIYAASSFDETGNMIAHRDDVELAENARYTTTVKPNNIDPESIAYVKEYKAFVESKGAKLYFTSPIIDETLLIEEGNALDTLPSEIERETGVRFISNPRDYLFNPKLMYDTPYHATSEGALIRSERLANDILKVIQE